MANIIGIDDFGISDSELRKEVDKLKKSIASIESKVNSLASDVSNIKNNQNSGGSSSGK